MSEVKHAMTYDSVNATQLYYLWRYHHLAKIV